MTKSEILTLLQGSFVELDARNPEKARRLEICEGHILYEGGRRGCRELVPLKQLFELTEDRCLHGAADWGFRLSSVPEAGDEARELAVSMDFAEGRELLILSELIEELDGRGLIVLGEYVPETAVKWIPENYRSSLKRRLNDRPAAPSLMSVSVPPMAPEGPAMDMRAFQNGPGALAGAAAVPAGPEKTCPVCGTKSRGGHFCTNCGSPLQQ